MTSTRTTATHFYAVRHRFLFLDQQYKVFITDSFLAIAWIGGQMSDEEWAKRSFVQYYWMVKLWVERKAEQRRRRDQECSEMDLSGPEFLRSDRRNRRVAWDDVIDARVTEKLGQMKRSIGSMNFSIRHGPVLRLSISPDQSVECISKELKARLSGLLFAPDQSPAQAWWDGIYTGVKIVTALVFLGLAAWLMVRGVVVTSLSNTDRLGCSMGGAIIALLVWQVWDALKEKRSNPYG